MWCSQCRNGDAYSVGAVLKCSEGARVAYVALDAEKGTLETTALDVPASYAEFSAVFRWLSPTPLAYFPCSSLAHINYAIFLLFNMPAKTKKNPVQSVPEKRGYEFGGP